MLPNWSPKWYSSALTLAVLTAYLLLTVPAPSQAEGMDSVKEELQLRDMEPKLEDSGALNSNREGPALTRFSSSNRRNQRSIGFGSKYFPVTRSKYPIELELLVTNDEAERPKRFDDYGHMRFGKRGGDDQFDDYGHMRFGR
ncbi:drosulfakinins [Drosophila novamexicana]|uniref:drosulfakinins n=1 Tax=Drosophila novamexicana TaxID=47314 RepID=UPI0011E59790|nr:drosulfakinins [Drosophila novamexicana]